MRLDDSVYIVVACCAVVQYCSLLNERVTVG